MKTNRLRTKRQPKGLVLLIVLGMLAMFSLLAVTYVVAASASRTGSRAILVSARQNNFDLEQLADRVFRDALRGTNNQSSPFFMNDILGDVYDRNAIKSSFAQINGATAPARLFTAAAAPITVASKSLPEVALVKISMNRITESGGPLSDLENEYNSRLLTILEGPLAGQTFRILKYVGYVDDNTGGNADPNVFQTTWSNQQYDDPNAENLAYSVLIDLNEVQGSQLSGQYYANGLLKSVSLPLTNWIADSSLGINTLFFKPRVSTNDPLIGFKFVINGAPFNGVGIGVEDVPSYPGGGPNQQFGNVDGRQLLRIPSNPSRPKVSIALLPHMDYLSDPTVMSTNPVTGVAGVDGIGLPRTNVNEYKLFGGTNEGIDVPDVRDFFLAHQTFNVGADNQLHVTPSYHRPAVIQYLAHLFGDPSTLAPAEMAELLQLIDMSSARVMSVEFNGIRRNPGFVSNDSSYPRVTSSSTVTQIQDFVRKQILGVWDVDNDGDGINDSVWIDAGLPIVYSPEGKRLRPLVAILIEDLDGKVNVNAAGDRVQPLQVSFPQTNANYVGGARAIANGFGFGPAEISIPWLLSRNRSTSPTATSQLNSFSFFDDRYGVRRNPLFAYRPINYTLFDREPGFRNLNDPASQLKEREIHGSLSALPPAFHLPGLPLARRGGHGLAFDINGNVALVNPSDTDVIPSNPTASSTADELNGDPYEARVNGKPSSDDPFTIAELEAILRRHSEDARSLPDRLRKQLEAASYNPVSDFISRELTTRSNELRHPNLGAIAKSFSQVYGMTVEQQPASMRQFIQMLYAQRYQRTRSFPPLASDDPPLTNAAFCELFPTEFTRGLRLDLNRAFANGFDDDADGQIDDPQELSTSTELETHFPTSVQAMGAYRREIRTQGLNSNGTINGLSRNVLGSRQILARNLYCLAQLIVPQSFNFPGMPNDTPVNFWPRAKIRARALAQWAINVVDFRDTDSAMTRFEYDILPFGVGQQTVAGNSLIRPRPAYWAPDRVTDQFGGIPNKTYVGVVWGMEYPELLLSETLAIHDKRVRDTDLDSTGKTTTDPTNPDGDFDQFRFPLASTFIELHATRTTDVPNNVLLPKVSSSLYTVDANGRVALDLGRLAPANGAWGRQPVWRIAISEDYTRAGANSANHPQSQWQSGGIDESLTHQISIESIGSDPLRNGVSNLDTASLDLEYYIGNGLRYQVNDDNRVSPENGRLDGFERFVWFTSIGPGANQNIPDVLNSIRTSGNQRQTVYYNRTGSAALLPGGGYLVVGPRALTPIGSLTHNQFTRFSYPSQTIRMDLVTPSNVPILSNSYQRIVLDPNAGAGQRGVSTYRLDGSEANLPWLSRIKAPISLICAADAPDDTAVPPNSDWALAFPNGVGLNVSLPIPVHGQSIWTAANRPLVRLNQDDTTANRNDGTPGFGDNITPPDSWVNLADNPITGTLPGTPIDKSNPLIGGAGRYASGTYENVRVAYLQRLADPEFGYDPVTNPYITVDWQTIDLTVFNGESRLGLEQADDPSNSPNVAFQTRYRNGQMRSGSGFSQNGVSVLSQKVQDLRFRPNAKQPNPPDSGTVQYESFFPYMLGYDMAVNWNLTQASASTLGYINVGYHTGGNLTDFATAPAIDPTGVLWDGFGPPQLNATYAYLGHGERVQNIAWYNRPFASPYEIALVPSSSQALLGLYHASNTSTSQRSPFPFLPSFLTSNPFPTNNNTAANQDNTYWGIAAGSASADWQMLLELVETQPPFADESKFIRPDHLLTVSMTDPVAERMLNSYLRPNYSGASRFEPETTRGPTLLAPFNNIPSFVSSGKVNLNTIALAPDKRMRVLEAIEYNYGRGSDVAAAFDASRRGYAPSTVPINSFFSTTVGNFHPSYPTEFLGAFRSGVSSNLAPALGVQTGPSLSVDQNLTARMRGRFGVESTLLRSANLDANVAANLPDTDPMLFNHAPTTPPALQQMQQFARMQRAMRLPNLTTNQSNVFSVWVTVSLFEYDPVNGFGNEYVGSNGQPNRSKKFYMIDRSIPVGYKPGETLNTEKTVLLKTKL